MPALRALHPGDVRNLGWPDEKGANASHQKAKGRLTVATTRPLHIRFVSPVPRPQEPPEVAREREQAFLNYLASTETAYLECRNGQHINRGISDQNTAKEVRDGMCHVEWSCPRCGTVIESVIQVQDGFLVGPKRRTRYQYPDGYLLPKEATGPQGEGMSKERRAAIRLELLERGFRAQGKSFSLEVEKDRSQQKKGKKVAQ